MQRPSSKKKACNDHLVLTLVATIIPEHETHQVPIYIFLCNISGISLDDLFGEEKQRNVGLNINSHFCHTGRYTRFTLCSKAQIQNSIDINHLAMKK